MIDGTYQCCRQAQNGKCSNDHPREISLHVRNTQLLRRITVMRSVVAFENVIRPDNASDRITCAELFLNDCRSIGSRERERNRERTLRISTFGRRMSGGGRGRAAIERRTIAAKRCSDRGMSPMHCRVVMINDLVGLAIDTFACGLASRSLPINQLLDSRPLSTGKLINVYM